MRIRPQTLFSEISLLTDTERRLGGAGALQICIRKRGDVTIVDIHGRATLEHSSSLDKLLQELVANGVRKLLLNLKSLRQVDSSGISIIMGAFVSVKSKGGDLRLLRPTGRVLEVFKLLRLLEIIPCHECESQALDSFQLVGCCTILEDR